jgi:hypothetical protein
MEPRNDTQPGRSGRFMESRGPRPDHCPRHRAGREPKGACPGCGGRRIPLCSAPAAVRRFHGWGWHGAPRHGTAGNHDVARTFALWRLQGLGASGWTLPPPPLDRGWEWLGAGLAVAASGSNQRSRTGLPGSTRPSCHLGGGQPGPCHPPWCGGARPMPDRNDGPGTAQRGGGQLALSLDPLGRGNLSLWLALFQCPWHLEHA